MTATPFLGADGGLAERILSAAEVKGRKRNVFSIGSFGTRVNFHAQQIRALNLVWALHEKGLLEKDQRYAVIGAGVTGLMLAAALISYDCIVDVYETGGATVPRQAETQHRYVHPTINAWPFRTPEITTQLPFLDWYVGQCDEIANDLRDQFQRIMTPESEILTGTTAEWIVEVAENKIMVQSPLTPSRMYRLAILAVGFGDERPAPEFNAQSYWTADNLEGNRIRNLFKDYVVSGCGDGGLIDALRVVHYNFRKGMLAFETAALLHGSKVASVIEIAEQSAGANAASKTADEIAELLKAAYEHAAGLIFDDPAYALVQAKLTDSLSKFHRILYITDAFRNPPFSPGSAPIHKLMIAHAKRAGKVSFLSGPVRIEPSEYVVRGKHFRDKAKTKVIARHGADVKAVLHEILEDFEVEDLVGSQPDSADLLADPHWSKPFPSLPGYPQHDPTSEPFIRSRATKVKALVRSLDRNAEVVRRVGGFEITFQGEVPTIVRSPLFGIPITTSALPDTMPLA